MRAIIRQAYGGPEQARLEDTAAPAVAPGAVLVRVQAAGVNAYDWHMLRGHPYLARATEGLRRPKDGRTGLDAAGVVEAVGEGVTGLRVGDAVFGARNGAFAELVSGATFVPIPAGLSFEAAAALPVAGCTALQAVRDKGEVRPGHRVLVTGAGGGVGHLAVQIATAHGGIVTAITSPPKVDMVRSLGPATVIDRPRLDLAEAGPHDVIIDAGGYRSLGDLRRGLTSDGTVVLVGPSRGQWVGPILHVVSAAIRSRLGRQRLRPFLSEVTRDDLLVLSGMVEAGTLRPVVDRTYPLAEAGEAIRYVEDGRAAGKIVLAI